MKFFFVIVILWLNPVWSAECLDFRFQETPFTACTAELPIDDVRLFLNDKTGKIFGQFHGHFFDDYFGQFLDNCFFGKLPLMAQIF